MFNNKLAKRKRIKDRGINWEEAYSEKTQKMKDRFERDLGEGSYRRWEGHDYSTNGDYFVVVSPALTANGDKMFFSGIKRLPPEFTEKKVYAPSGEYFPTISGALSHASDKWGVPFPHDQIRYTREDLEPIKISRHVKASSDKEIK